MTRREGASLLREAGMDLPYEAAASLRPARRGLAGRAVPGRPVAARRARPAARRRPLRGGRPLRGRLPARRAAGRAPAGAAGLPRPGPPCSSGCRARLCDAVLGPPGRGPCCATSRARTCCSWRSTARTTSFRYHRLLARGAARGAAARASPSVERRLHRRASAWYAGGGDVDSAIEHAIQARDAAPRRRSAVAVRGRLRHGRPSRRARSAGSTASRPTRSPASPPLALTAATLHLAMGDRDRLEHWATVADGAPAPPTARRSRSCRRGRPRRGRPMAADAARGRALGADGAWLVAEPPADGRRRAPARRPRRRARRPRGGRPPRRVAAPLVQALCLAQLALLALDADDLEGGRAARRPRAGPGRPLRPRGLPDRAPRVRRVGARARAPRPASRTRRRTCAARPRCSPALTDCAPWYAVETHVTLARAALRLGDVAAARGLLAAAARGSARGARRGRAERWIAGVRAQVDAFSAACASGPASLTTAELRVLRVPPDPPLVPRDRRAPTCRATRSRRTPTPSTASSTSASLRGGRPRARTWACSTAGPGAPARAARRAR